jgi:acyl carrier protein
MEYGRFGLASVAAGALRTALDRTHHYAAARQIATGRLSENGHYKVAIGEVLLETDALDAVVRIVGEHLDRTGELPQLYSLTCKILAGETGFTGVDRALQFTGGRGYTETFGLGRIWRDIRLLRIFEGPTEAVSAHLGSLVLRRPDIVLDAFASSDRDGKDQAVAEASRLVKMAAALHGSSEGLEAFVVELGIFTARQVAIAALLMSCTNEQVRSAAQFKRNALSFALGIRINEIAGLAAAFEALSRPQRASAQEPRTAPIFDTWSGSISSPVGSEHLPGDEAGRDVATPLEKVTPRPVISHEPPSRPPRPATAEATAWLVAWIAKATKTHVMDPDHFLTGCGIDSLLAFELHCSIEEEFNIRLPESIFTEDLTIRQLGERIGGKMNTAADA